MKLQPANLKRVHGAGRWRSLRLFGACGGNYLEAYRLVQKQYGNVTSLFLPGLRYVVSHPDGIRWVLKDNQANYRKSADYRELRLLLGQGLLTSEGELWKSERRTIASEFTNEKAKQMAAGITAATERIAERWKAIAANGTEVDMSAQMMELTFEIAGEAFFGQELAPHAALVAKAFADASEAAIARMLQPVKLPLWVPTQTNRKYRRAVRCIDGVVYRLIAERGTNPSERVDLLSRLLKSSAKDGA